MENETPSQKSDRIRRLEPPKSTRASMIMNGAGNGMMLGGLPYLATQLYSGIAHKKIAGSVKSASEFAVVLGAAVGAAYGAKEARELDTYRDALRNELSDLRMQSDANTARLNGSWTEKEQARPVPVINEPSR